MTDTAESRIALAKKYFASVNGTRLDDLASCFAEDAVLTFPAYDPIRSRQSIRNFYAAVLQAYPERFDNVTDWFISDGGLIAAKIHFEGKTAAGRSVIFDAVDVFNINNDLIETLTIFYDSVKVSRMVGV